MMGILPWLHYVKNLRALYEYHQSTHSAYRNKQIIQACFAHVPQCLWWYFEAVIYRCKKTYPKNGDLIIETIF